MESLSQDLFPFYWAAISQSAFTYSTLTIKTLEQGVKHAQN